MATDHSILCGAAQGGNRGNRATPGIRSPARATVACVAGDYRSVIIGASGGRARHHALAYRHQRRAKLVAVSARTADKRDELADAYGVAARYDDYREMLARERPDVVHVNTPPDARLELLEQIAAAGVPTAIIEKPIAIDGPDCAALAAFARTSPLRVAVNHQLHYHAPRRRLQRLVADGAIGRVRFIDASTGMNAAYQGTHALQSIFAFAGGEQPAAVLGQASRHGRSAAVAAQSLRPRRPAGGDRLRRRPARRAALRRRRAAADGSAAGRARGGVGPQAHYRVW